MEKAIRLGFSTLRTLFEMGASNVQLFTNLRLVAIQFDRSFATRDERIEAYLDIPGSCAQQFKSVTITHMPRSEIRHADTLAFLSRALPIDEERTLDIGIQHESSI